MTRVIDAAVGRGVAIEIGARYKLPSERFLRLAKAKGAKFSFGTNTPGLPTSATGRTRSRCRRRST